MSRGRKRKNSQEAIEDFKKVHGDNYDYSEVEFIKTEIKVKIICKKCGKSFLQRPASHLRGTRCGHCYGSARLTTDEFIKRSRKIHGNKYIYPEMGEHKTEYIKSFIKTWIVCPEHGLFQQEPRQHLNGRGCKECGYDRTREAIKRRFGKC